MVIEVVLNQKLKSTEGVILRSLPFRDHDQILTIFTQDLGMVKAIMEKKKLSKKASSTTDPLTRAEFILSDRKNSLMRCQDISLLNQNLSLRGQLNWLDAAYNMACAIDKTQMLQKPAPDLYRLLISYLEKIPLIPEPKILISSFYLKLLRHEGLLNMDEFNLSLTEEESKIAKTLNFSRSFQELATVTLPPLLFQKSKTLFEKFLLDE